MAILDPRMVPLIETLTASGADWLAFELVEAVRRGVAQEEAEEVLAATRERVRQGEFFKLRPERRFESDTERFRLGDEQVAWAGQYVVERLEAAVGFMEASLGNLDEIVGQVETSQSAKASTDVRSTIVLQQDEGGREFSRGDEGRARAGLQDLRIAVERWTRESIGRALP